MNSHGGVVFMRLVQVVWTVDVSLGGKMAVVTYGVWRLKLGLDPVCG